MEYAQNLPNYKNLEKIEEKGNLLILSVVRFVREDYENRNKFHKAFNDFIDYQSTRGLSAVILEADNQIFEEVHIATTQKVVKSFVNPSDYLIK